MGSEGEQIDQELLADFAKIARELYSLVGIGIDDIASMEPEQLERMPKSGVIELLINDRLQNIIFDHSNFPLGLREEIHSHIETHHSEERRTNWTDEEFYFRFRKKAWGAFKKQLWAMDERSKHAILADVETEIGMLFDKLGLLNTRKLIEKYYSKIVFHKFKAPEELYLG
jgi:hypothetical protein